PSARLTSGADKPGPNVGNNGDEVIVGSTFTLSEIKVRFDVLVERRYNTAATGGAKGEKGRPLAIPDFRAQARTVLTAKYAHSVDGWRKTGGAWATFSRNLPGGANTENGLFGDRLFLKDAVCEAVEPPTGTRYNNFEQVEIGTW